MTQLTLNLAPDDPRNVRCPTCSAQEGQLCQWPRPDNLPGRIASGLTHAARRAIARAKARAAAEKGMAP
jgi:hypothetical protein